MILQRITAGDPLRYARQGFQASSFLMIYAQDRAPAAGLKTVVHHGPAFAA